MWDLFSLTYNVHIKLERETEIERERELERERA